MSNTDAVSRNGSEIFKTCMAEIGVQVDLVIWDDCSNAPEFIFRYVYVSNDLGGAVWLRDMSAVTILLKCSVNKQKN